MLSSEKIRAILNNHREMIEKLNSELTAVRKENQELHIKLESVKQTIQQAQLDARDLIREALANKSEASQKKQPTISIGDTQLLVLLYNIGAIGSTTSTPVITIKQAFRLADSEKTIMRRMNNLELQGLVEHTGFKPKRFFLTENGLVILNKERKSVLSTQAGTESVNFDTLRH